MAQQVPHLALKLISLYSFKSWNAEELAQEPNILLSGGLPHTYYNLEVQVVIPANKSGRIANNVARSNYFQSQVHRPSHQEFIIMVQNFQVNQIFQIHFIRMNSLFFGNHLLLHHDLMVRADWNRFILLWSTHKMGVGGCVIGGWRPTLWSH